MALQLQKTKKGKSRPRKEIQDADANVRHYARVYTRARNRLLHLLAPPETMTRGSGVTHTPCPLRMFKVHTIMVLFRKRYFDSPIIYLHRYPVTSAVQEVEFMNMWWSNLDRVTFPAADILIFFVIWSAVLIHTNYSYKVTLQGEEPHWTH